MDFKTLYSCVNVVFHTCYLCFLVIILFFVCFSNNLFPSNQGSLLFSSPCLNLQISFSISLLYIFHCNSISEEKISDKIKEENNKLTTANSC